MTDFLQIVTTASSREEAESIAQSLVGRRLAACVQVWGPVHSTYRWQDHLESGQEWGCAIKTRKALFGAVEQAIRELHSYEVPEILAFDISHGSAAYLEWLAANVRIEPSDG
jgi:periplasmic divalent cation tolerance protein